MSKSRRFYISLSFKGTYSSRNGLERSNGNIVSLKSAALNSIVPAKDNTLGSKISSVVSGVLWIISFICAISSSDNVEHEAFSKPFDKICLICCSLSRFDGLSEEDRDIGAGEGGTENPPCIYHQLQSFRIIH